MTSGNAASSKAEKIDEFAIGLEAASMPIVDGNMLGCILASSSRFLEA